LDIWQLPSTFALPQCGIPCVPIKYTYDKDEIRPGDLFAEALEETLESCSAIALIISPEAMDSGWVKEEYYRL
jgi:hypothetical protein